MDDTAPVVATADADLLEVALRLCVATGSTPSVVDDVHAARRRWARAGFVLVGDDLAPGLVLDPPPRRDGVHLLTRAPDACWRAAVGIGAQDVVDVGGDLEEVVEALSARAAGRADACVVAVVGAAGGVGASTLAAALALRAASRGLAPLLVDADPVAGGLDLVLGAEHAPGMRWADVDRSRGSLNGEALRGALPVHDGVRFLSGDRRAAEAFDDAAVASVLSAARRTADLVVVDAPRHPGGVLEAVAARSVATVLVVPEDVRALGGAAALLRHVDAAPGRVVLVTRPVPSGLGAGATGDTIGHPAVARLRRERRVAAAVALGLGPGGSRGLRRAADKVLAAVGLVA